MELPVFLGGLYTKNPAAEHLRLVPTVRGQYTSGQGRNLTGVASHLRAQGDSQPRVLGVLGTYILRHYLLPIIVRGCQYLLHSVRAALEQAAEGLMRPRRFRRRQLRYIDIQHHLRRTHPCRPAEDHLGLADAY